jgi:hypothetical protein
MDTDTNKDDTTPAADDAVKEDDKEDDKEEDKKEVVEGGETPAEEAPAAV